MPPVRKTKEPMQILLDRAAGPMGLAKALKVSHQFVYICIKRGWFPPARAAEIEDKFGVPRKKLINPQLAKLLFC